MSDRELEEISQILTDALALQGVTSSQPSDSVRTRMLANIKRRANAAAPAGTYTIRANDVSWEDFDEGIQRKCLVGDHGDGSQTCVYRLRPGAKFVSHAHSQQESCWVIAGDILVGDHHVQAGEMHIAEPNYDHPEIYARTEALLLIRSQVYVGPLTPS